MPYAVPASVHTLGFTGICLGKSTITLLVVLSYQCSPTLLRHQLINVGGLLAIVVSVLHVSVTGDD